MPESLHRGRASLLRKLIHLATTIVPAAAWLGSYQLALALAGTALVASLILEGTRRWWPWVNQTLWQLFPSLFRVWEDRRVLGSTWFSIGMLVALLAWGRDAGSTAVLFLAWGDPVAELVGRRWGRAGQGKTLPGSLGCLAACLLAAAVAVGLGHLNPWAALAGALVATAVERWSPPPDDNLWIPVLSGLAIVSIQRVLG